MSRTTKRLYEDAVYGVTFRNTFIVGVMQEALIISPIIHGFRHKSQVTPEPRQYEYDESKNDQIYDYLGVYSDENTSETIYVDQHGEHFKGDEIRWVEVEEYKLIRALHGIYD